MSSSHIKCQQIRIRAQELQTQTEATHYKNSAAYASNHSSIAPSRRQSGDDSDEQESANVLKVKNKLFARLRQVKSEQERDEKQL